MVLIKCRQLTLGYGNKDIVSDFDYDINAGEYLCIVGRNGSGKTTLLRGISGLLSPKSGSIELCDGLTRNQIGYLPQITNVQKDFPASVREIVLSGCLNRTGRYPFYRKEEKERAELIEKRRKTGKPQVDVSFPEIEKFDHLSI